MKKHVLFLAALLAMTTLFSCNAQKTVDASSLVEAISSLTEDTDFVVTGELTDDMLEKIGGAIISGNYKVGLDLSKTTGLTKIGKAAFYGCTGLTSITIPDSVTAIGVYAFQGCTGLTSVTIPDSVTGIGEAAFSRCTGLTSVTIPDGVTEIGKFAFYGCPGLTSVTIPDSVTEIGEAAFKGCTGLEKITVSKGNKVYDSRNNCNAIIRTEYNDLIVGCKNTVIPDSVTWIFWSAFYGCTGLTSVTIPDSVTRIGDYAFYGCAGLEKITVSKGNKVYDSRNNCNAIIRTKDNVLIAGCKNTVIPDSVTGIGEAAFHGCTGLTSITIPDSVTGIGDYAFKGCTGLGKITVSKGNKVYDSRNNCNAIIITEDNDLIVGCKNTVIPDSVTRIGEDVFYGCTGLTSVTIPDSVTGIWGNAFSGCSGLEKITVSKDNKVYDSRNNCNAIISTEYNVLIAGCKNTVIPDSVTQIGEDAFLSCTELASITIPDSVTQIGAYAFCDCTELTNVIIPNSITAIGEDAFYGCTGLTSVTIPDSVTAIGEDAFYGCTNLKTINASERVKEMVRAAM